ncbi:MULTISPECIES: ROK family protein [unclassified Arthrobacter]|uniref:ROK family protein n=1 Tax=unclassified Arthrobacter TaxID=235627 RepID=UPI001C85A914|nr:ROK family protein [Arthrobacter sp. MAHUQ-56]MBX7445913.1 ROK family protein [Arthrobacter sp. MAHUQ-56]
MANHTQTLSAVIGLVRSGTSVTRPELMRQTGLGRTVISQRVDDALRAGIIREEEDGVSTGGRPSKVLRIAQDRGYLLAAVFGASRAHIAITDLAGGIVHDRAINWDIAAGPEESLHKFSGLVDELMSPGIRENLWAVGIGLPGPVNFASGIPVSPPIMPGWGGFPVRERLEAAFGVPVWVDNDCNLMALGTWTRTHQTAGDNVLFIKAGTGIGAGLISRRQLHRGAKGAAGDIGHLIIAEESRVQCRCGKFGCLESFASGWALARDGYSAAIAGRSPYLAKALENGKSLSVMDVIYGSNEDDAACRELILRAGHLIGAQVAGLVNVFNPSTVYLGGSLALTGSIYRDIVRDAVIRRSLPLAVDDLVLAEVALQHNEGVFGAAELALGELFQPDMLGRWLHQKTPQGLSAAVTKAREPRLAG